MQTPSNSDLRGIDVSRWQGSIDWQAVRGMAVEIAYIKSSEGADYIDPYFEPIAEAARVSRQNRVLSARRGGRVRPCPPACTAHRAYRRIYP